jgi:branched-chain amino acid transport system ATP-binding protein
MPSPVLSIEGLHVRYGAIDAVRNVTFSLGEGEIVALIGPNGAGKSSCANAIVGLVPSSGTITLRGQSIAGAPTERMISLGLSLVPEGRRVFPRLSVLENLIAGGVSRTPAERKKSKEDILDLFPALSSRLQQQAGTLSGGEQQMLAIGRALMGAPNVLLLDEPSLGLAPQIVDDIFQLIVRLRDRGVAILLVEQNAERAMEISDRTLVMVGGVIRREAKSAELAQSKLAEKLYMGATL